MAPRPRAGRARLDLARTGSHPAGVHTAAQLHRHALAACRRTWRDRDGIEDAAQEAVARWLALPAGFALTSAGVGKTLINNPGFVRWLADTTATKPSGLAASAGQSPRTNSTTAR